MNFYYPLICSSPYQIHYQALSLFFLSQSHFCVPVRLGMLLNIMFCLIESHINLSLKASKLISLMNNDIK